MDLRRLPLQRRGNERSSASVTEADNLEADPFFVAWSDDGDYTNDDLHLEAGSPAIDMGASGYGTCTTDYDGVTRPLDGDMDGSADPDAGAYEFDPDEDDDGYSGGEDCDDADASVNDGATELCNGVDDDCDGTIDEPDAADATTWYADADGDGYGDPSVVTVDCATPTGYVTDATDCDDTLATSSPGATETCGDQLDQDCDGADLDCPDTGDTGDTSDTGDTGDTAEREETGELGEDATDPDVPPSTCGCATGGGDSRTAVGALLLLAVAGRRRRGGRR